MLREFQMHIDTDTLYTASDLSNEDVQMNSRESSTKNDSISLKTILDIEAHIKSSRKWTSSQLNIDSNHNQSGKRTVYG